MRAPNLHRAAGMDPQGSSNSAPVSAQDHPNPLSEGGVQTLLELQQLRAVPTALGSPFHAHHPLVQTLSLTSSCPSPAGSMPFPRALSLSQRAELSAAPRFPVRSCSRHEASPQLLCSALSKPRDLSPSSHILPSRPFPIFIASDDTPPPRHCPNASHT